MENFQDRGVWIRIRSLKNYGSGSGLSWEVGSGFGLSWEVGSGTGLSWVVGSGSGQYQTGSETLLMSMEYSPIYCFFLIIKSWRDIFKQIFIREATSKDYFACPSMCMLVCPYELKLDITVTSPPSLASRSIFFIKISDKHFS